MSGLLVLLVIGFVLWKLWTPATAWAPGFATLLDRPVKKTGFLHVSFEDGWLKARWQPGGFMIFPGQFEPQRWRSALPALSVITRSLESARS